MKSQIAKITWDSIKNQTSLVVSPAFESEYDAPYKQPLADYGWEDGLHISPDGLNLYALYSPMDLLSKTSFSVTHQYLPLCDWLATMSFMRPYAKTYGMDLTDQLFGCDSFPNIDILYAHRNSVKDSFTTWQLSGIARAVYTEGGPAPLFSAKDSTKVDIFMFTGDGDIWMIKNTTANPAGINSAIRLPSPINPVVKEFTADNAFLERIHKDTILLMYEKYTNSDDRVFMYSFTIDSGNTWSAPVAITTITNVTASGHIEHPCLYQDSSKQWWLYFSINYTNISRAKQTIAGNWNSWGTPEVIISKGNALSIGEPTLTKNGDISFSVAYKNTVTNDTNDVYDLDPWILPCKPKKYLLTVNSGSGSGSYIESAIVQVAAATAPSGKIFDKWTGDIQYLINITDSLNKITMPGKNVNVTATYKNKPNSWNRSDNLIRIYPNPASDYVEIISTDNINGSLFIINSSGETIREGVVYADHIRIDVSGLPNGLYVLRIISENESVVKTILIQ